MLPPATHQTLPKISPIVYQSEQTKLAPDEHVFNSTKDLYNNALENNGYKQNIKFQHNVFV